MNNGSYDKRVDAFIKNERSLDATPFMAIRVMAKLEALSTHETSRRRPVWATIALAALLTGAILGGISLGNSYKAAPMETKAIVINDHAIENLGSYFNLDSE